MIFVGGLTTAFARSLFAVCILAFVASCAGAKANGEKPGLAIFKPVNAQLSGVVATNGSFVFEDKDKTVRLGVRQLKKHDVSGLEQRLMDDGYALFEVSVKNSSSAKVVYSPSNTVLKDKERYYKKPLDYTDFYDLLGRDEYKEHKRSLDTLKARFFDLDVTLGPGGEITRVACFAPFPEDSKKAELVVYDLYVGHEPHRITFPFVVERRR